MGVSRSQSADVSARYVLCSFVPDKILYAFFLFSLDSYALELSVCMSLCCDTGFWLGF